MRNNEDAVWKPKILYLEFDGIHRDVTNELIQHFSDSTVGHMTLQPTLTVNPQSSMWFKAIDQGLLHAV